jgi:hypothetical protein
MMSFGEVGKDMKAPYTIPLIGRVGAGMGQVE